MDLLGAIEERRSTRAFLETPVDREKMETLIRYATQAPSAINLQPWELTVVSGEEKKRLSRILVKRMKERNISCGPGAKSPLPDYFVQRQRRLLDTIQPNLPGQIPFQDFINEGSCNFYGAPAAILISIDNVFLSARLTDIGVLVAYLLLSAHALGLGTCPIGLITAFDDDIKEILSIPENKQVVIGVAVGYRDTQSPINRSRSERVPLGDVVRWRE
ncbi:MAG: nitroreductase [Desulfobacteraceae bacterium]|nr:nitroreductase [Desulfobacterales bacterium]MBL6968040.1 nitroreductase [Desulfobacteraceae bacterium]MBL7101199.1 nitroreductase [Desulfobacteraceae bacterium]MBL7171928.1 nitroreductase [Desulfobacteraceae bacterium]